MEQAVPPAPPQTEAESDGSQTQRGNRNKVSPPTSSTATGIQESEPGNSSPTPSTSTDPAFLSQEPAEKMATASPNSGALTSSNDDSGPLPFNPEYQLVPEGGSTNQSFELCEKNPGHPNFIPVTDLTREHLPEVWRTDDVMEKIKLVCDRTVRVVVRYMSPCRPDNYLNCDKRGKYCSLYGTGFIEGWSHTIERVANERCPCGECKTSTDPMMEYVKVEVTTAKHVVFDTSEAEHTKIELFYNSDDRSNVITFDGVEVEYADFHCDTSSVVCVNHDMSLYDKLSGLGGFEELNRIDIPAMASHPHGVSKRISIGSFYKRIDKVVIPTDEPFTFKVGRARKCRLCKSKKATSLELESFQDLVDSDTPCQPGVWYRVREGMEMSCDPSTCWMDSNWVGEYNQKYVRFPSDVEFKFVNGNDSKSFPDVEFELEGNEYGFLQGKSVICHHEYDMATCEGSSGAWPGGGPWGYWPHSGYNEFNCINMTGQLIWKK